MALNSKHKSYGLHEIKAGLLLFWGVWFVLVVLTNSFDILSTYDALPAEWRFRSGNLALIISIVNIYRFSGVFANLLFLSGLIAESVIAILFIVAALKFWSRRPAWKWVNAAFGISIAFWAVFILLDELFIAYNFEGTHSTLLISEVLILLAIHLLPETDR